MSVVFINDYHFVLSTLISSLNLYLFFNDGYNMYIGHTDSYNAYISNPLTTITKELKVMTSDRDISRSFIL